ncbi:hypothetical protein CDAR_406851 [Caerostris darwini]|uniref:Uncharacterized protein n=1 Tax=Caerostris darwini TaxID=1538125 RepID=A0AAV4R702_9ARAC|nr:hypothetical protein CDAR_406851 [Caerostris darwini]
MAPPAEKCNKVGPCYNYSEMFIFALLSCIALVQAELYDNYYSDHRRQPYSFGYAIADQHGQQHRQESANRYGGIVGSYGFTDDRGVARRVHYVADHAGFRAQVLTNEPGTANQDPANVNVVSNAYYH